MKVGIVGGGASGLLCAILLKKFNSNIIVTILEQNDRVGKKILQTGNGMCNMDNEDSNNIDNYNTPLIKELIGKYDYKYIKKVFSELGLLTLTDSEGRIYPYSRKASNVLDIMLSNIKVLDINVKTNYQVKEIEEVNGSFIVNKDLKFDYLVLACGGCASINGEYKLKSLSRSLNLNWVDVTPSLTPLKVKESVKSLSGIKVKASVSYFIDGLLKEKRSGELLFKDDGISGIVVLELSRNFDKDKQNKVSIDMFDEYEEYEVANIIQANYHKFVNLTDALIGLVPKMIALDVIKKGNNDIRKIAYLLKNYSLTVINTYDFASSQVMRGGVDLNCLKLDCFESKKNHNLYVIGEGVNVDGTCGGFNLHFAWVSAIVCAKSIINKATLFN